MEENKNSDTGTRTLVSCVKGKYANHLHHIGDALRLRVLENNGAITVSASTVPIACPLVIHGQMLREDSYRKCSLCCSHGGIFYAPTQFQRFPRNYCCTERDQQRSLSTWSRRGLSMRSYLWCPIHYFLRETLCSILRNI